MPRHVYPKLPNVRGPEERNVLVVQWLKLAYRMARTAESRSPLVRSLGREAVDDLAVDALVRAAELWDPAKGKSFPSYLCQWVLLSVKSRARQAAKVASRVPVADGLDPNLLPAASPEDPDGWERREQIGRLLSSLTSPQREALELLYLEGVSSVAAGRRLGVTKSAVLFRRDRAFDNIRKAFGDRSSVG